MTQAEKRIIFGECARNARYVRVWENCKYIEPSQSGIKLLEDARRAEHTLFCLMMDLGIDEEYFESEEFKRAEA